MKICEVCIRKRLELMEEFALHHSYLKSICHFYSAYNLALAITGFEDKNMRKKNKLFKRFISNYISGKNNIKIFNRIKNYMKEDVSVIVKALKIMQQQSEDLGYEAGTMYKDLIIGISEWDYQE